MRIPSCGGSSSGYRRPTIGTCTRLQFPTRPRHRNHRARPTEVGAGVLFSDFS